MAEQYNELFMKNHEICPVGFAPFLEVNMTNYNPLPKSGKDSSSN